MTCVCTAPEAPVTPFELACVADSYDLPKNSAAGSVQTLLTPDGLRYPAAFGSSGGEQFLQILRRLRKASPEVTSLLELGCGTGAFLQVLRDNGFTQAYTGLDLSHEHVARARRYYPDARFHAGTATDLPFPDREFGFVFENNMFPFLLHPERVIREMVRVSSGFIFFRAHATPMQNGAYGYQPIYAPASIVPGPDGSGSLSLPESLEPALRPNRIRPALVRPSGPNAWKVAIAKCRKHYLSVDRLKALVRELPVEIIEECIKPLGRYPLIVTQELSADNRLATLLAAKPDGPTSDDDVLIDIDAMDAEYVLRVT